MEFYIELSECTCKSFERRVADVDFGGKWCESPLCIFHSLRKENLVKTGSKKIKRKDFDHKVEYFPFAPVFLFLRWIVRIRNKLRYESVNKNQSIIDETRNSGAPLLKDIWAQDATTLREKMWWPRQPQPPDSPLPRPPGDQSTAGPTLKSAFKRQRSSTTPPRPPWRADPSGQTSPHREIWLAGAGLEKWEDDFW